MNLTGAPASAIMSEIEKTMKASPYIKECIVVADGRKFDRREMMAAKLPPGI